MVQNSYSQTIFAEFYYMSGCTVLLDLAMSVEQSIPSCLLGESLVSGSILLDEKWYLIVVLTYILLMTNDVEQVLM